MKRKSTQLIIPLKHFPLTSQYASEIISYRKQQLGGNALNWCSEREEACHAFQPDAKPPECCAICQPHKDSPSRHVITRHSSSTRCLWASPQCVQKEQILPCKALGSLDHLTKWKGQEAASTWGTEIKQMKKEMHPVQSMLLMGKKEQGSIYFFPGLFF